MLSNVVGQLYIDIPIKEWLNTQGVPYTYVRYCDNIAVGFDTELTPEFKAAYKAFVKGLKYKIHMYTCTTNDNPKRHQKFIGIVLNKQARVEKKYSDRVICTLFNLCVKEGQVERYMRYNPKVATVTNDWGVNDYGKLEKILPVLRGKVSYMKSIDVRSHTRASKLLYVVENKIEAPVEIIKTYRNNKENITDFTKKIDSFLHI
jgi:hypothetical protein